MSLPAAAQADIFRWDNGQLIPGTEGITPGPATEIGARALQFAELSNTNLTGSWFYDKMLHGSDLTGARFTNANLSYTVLTKSNLSGADFSGATIIGTYLYGTQGFTKEQLYSTASYQAKDLHDIGLGFFLDLSGWDLSGQDLTGAAFSGSTLTDANLAGAYLANAYFDGATLTNTNLAGAYLTNAHLDRATLTDTNLAGANFAGAIVTGASFLRSRGFAKEQLYSMASYQQRDLRGIGLSGHNLTGWDFSWQDLSGADLGDSTLTNANLAGANLTNAALSGALTNANLAGAIVTGARFGTHFTKEQLYSTASYQQRDLNSINLSKNDLTGWDFSGQDLTGADLAGANLAGAMVTGARFDGTTSEGFTKEQLYSTASYQQRNLRGIGLGGKDLTGWDLSGQDLTDANFFMSLPMGGQGAILTNTNLSGAIVNGVDFTFATGFLKEQLYSTASYQQKDLRGIGLIGIDLTGWDFSFTDLRGALLSEPIQLARNTIRAFGEINGLDLAAGETLIVRDSDMRITVNDSMHSVSGGTLELVLGDTFWGSTVTVEADITPDLGGTLRVRFADQTNLAPLLGRSFDFFNWPGVLDTNNRFDAIELPPGTQWDLTQLYVTGMATLTAIPEPSAVLLFVFGTAVCGVARRRILANRLRL
jgi:uncharacterized protein YjbI with pentapeptide repeats